MLRTLWNCFLVGAVNRPRKRKRKDREIPGQSPDKSGKSRTNRERTKKDRKGRTSPDQEAPCLKSPFGTAVDISHYCGTFDIPYLVCACLVQVLVACMEFIRQR